MASSGDYRIICEAAGVDDSRVSALFSRAPLACWSIEYRDYLVSRGQILVITERVLGTCRSAENWLERPAFGLGDKVPCDLIITQAGCTLVKDLLIRIEYGVYT